MGNPNGATKTAVIVPVREADAVVGTYRQELDHTVSWPVPAHVTVLYPFLAPERITDSVLDDVRASLGAVTAFACTFSHVAWFGQDVLWLAPDPDAPFRALTQAVVRRFPECPPYRGAHPDPTPHLTVGSTYLASPADLQRAAGELQARPPIRARVDRVHLIAGSDRPGSWHTVSEFALPSAESS